MAASDQSTQAKCHLVSSGCFTKCCEPAFKLSPTAWVQGLSSQTLAKLSSQHALQTTHC